MQVFEGEEDRDDESTGTAEESGLLMLLCVLIERRGCVVEWVAGTVVEVTELCGLDEAVARGAEVLTVGSIESVLTGLDTVGIAREPSTGLLDTTAEEN